MKHGFIKVASVTPGAKTADVAYNKEVILAAMDQLESEGAKVIVFPELCVTGAECGDLFYQTLLLDEARKALVKIAEHTSRKDYICFVGLPLEFNGKIYNVAAAMADGKVLGLVPKTHAGSAFEKGPKHPVPVAVDEDHIVPMGTSLLFTCRQMPGLSMAVEIGEDLLAPNPPGIGHAMSGATVMIHLSAAQTLPGKICCMESILCAQAARLLCGYVHADAKAAHMIVEQGEILAKATQEDDYILSELDVQVLGNERRSSEIFSTTNETYITVEFGLNLEQTALTRKAGCEGIGLDLYIRKLALELGCTPSKIYRQACAAYEGQYEPAQIEAQLRGSLLLAGCPEGYAKLWQADLDQIHAEPEKKKPPKFDLFSMDWEDFSKNYME